MEPFVISGIVTASKSFLAHMIDDSYDLMKESTIQQYPHLQNVISELDLKADLQVIESLLSEIKEEDFNRIKDDSKAHSPISICLKNVSDMVALINTELENIKREIDEDEQRWFAHWRTPTYVTHLKNLVKHKKILDKRLELLIKILQL